MNDSTFDDLRDNLLFNFNDDDDLNMFMREVRIAGKLRVNVSLFGSDYLSNNKDVS
jgi:hypothetical protein